MTMMDGLQLVILVVRACRVFDVAATDDLLLLHVSHFQMASTKYVLQSLRSRVWQTLKLRGLNTKRIFALLLIHYLF